MEPKPSPSGYAHRYSVETWPLSSLPPEEIGRMYELCSPASDSHMRTLLRNRTLLACCWLARESGLVTGWAVTQWYLPFSAHPRNAHLSVSVDPAYRRQGIGRVLAGEAITFALAHNLTPGNRRQPPLNLLLPGHAASTSTSCKSRFLSHEGEICLGLIRLCLSKVIKGLNNTKDQIEHKW